MTLLTPQVFSIGSQSTEHLNVPFGPAALRGGFPIPDHRDAHQDAPLILNCKLFSWK